MTTMWGFRGGARWAVVLAALSVLLVASPPTYAQFVSGSDGSDGAITFSVPSGLSSVTFTFDPRTICSQVGVACTKAPGTGGAVELDDDGDNVYHFTTVTVGQSVTVRFWAKYMRNPGPVVWLATGNVAFGRYGTLTLNGEGGDTGGPNLSTRGRSEPGPGGFPGGVAAKPSDAPTPGLGPGGATIPNGSQSGCPAGHVVAITTSRCPGGGSKYGSDSIQPLIGGSGGSGGAAIGQSMGGGGGAGGGAIRISSSSTITLPYQGGIYASGGSSYNNGNGGYQGGAGSGGAIHLQATTVDGCYEGNLRVDGARGPGDEYSSSGRIRIDGTYSYGCNHNGVVPLNGPAVNVPLPPPPASVRVVSFGGQSVPDVPGAAYTAPDVNIDSTAPLTVAIEAKNIPRGTVVKLIVSSEGSGAGTADQTVDTTPLAGDSDALTTATAQVTLPRGVSRVFVRAVW